MENDPLHNAADIIYLSEIKYQGLLISIIRRETTNSKHQTKH
jgi:hypothetical protein